MTNPNFACNFRIWTWIPMQFRTLWSCAGFAKDNPTSLQNMLKIIQFIWFGGIWVNENIHRWMRPLIPLWYWIFCVFEQATEKWNKIKYEYDQSGAPSHTIILYLRKYWCDILEAIWFGWIRLFWREVRLSLEGGGNGGHLQKSCTTGNTD